MKSAHPPADLLKTIVLVAFDFDGVMTDNRVLVMGNGDEAVFCNRSDGLGIDMVRAADIPMMVISTETHPIVAARCKKLKLPCYQGIGDKAEFLREYMKDKELNPARVAYLGNDVNDLGCLQMVGCPVVVADAHLAVMSAAKIVLTLKGGKGAVREFCDMLLASR